MIGAAHLAIAVGSALGLSGAALLSSLALEVMASGLADLLLRIL